MRRRALSARARAARGFTLVELLVAMAVLSLLILLLGQVVTLTSQAITLNAKQLDAAGQARLVFDRLAADWAARPQRPDLGMVFNKADQATTYNDSFQFYSEVDGYSGARQVAAVGYRIPEKSATGPLYQLERGAVGTDWGGANAANPLVQFLPNVLTPPLDSDPNYDVLAGGVFRLRYRFLLNTGVMSNANGSTLTGTPAATDFSNVTALVVALGVLDASSQQLLTTSQLAQLCQDLTDTIETQDPVLSWNSQIAQTGFAPGIPRRAVQGLGLYERTFRVR